MTTLVCILIWCLVGLLSTVFLLCIDTSNGDIVEQTPLALFGMVLGVICIAPVAFGVAIYAAYCGYINTLTI